MKTFFMDDAGLVRIIMAPEPSIAWGSGHDDWFAKSCYRSLPYSLFASLWHNLDASSYAFGLAAAYDACVTRLSQEQLFSHVGNTTLLQVYHLISRLSPNSSLESRHDQEGRTSHERRSSMTGGCWIRSCFRFEFRPSCKTAQIGLTRDNSPAKCVPFFRNSCPDMKHK